MKTAHSPPPLAFSSSARSFRVPQPSFRVQTTRAGRNPRRSSTRPSSLLPILATSIITALGFLVPAATVHSAEGSYDQELDRTRARVVQIDTEFREKVRRVEEAEHILSTSVSQIRLCVLGDTKIEFQTLLLKIDRAQGALGDLKTTILGYRDNLVDRKIELDGQLNDYLRNLDNEYKEDQWSTMRQFYAKNHSHYIQANYVDNMEFRVFDGLTRYENEVTLYMELNKKYFSKCQSGSGATQLLLEETVLNSGPILDGILDRVEAFLGSLPMLGRRGRTEG